MTCLNCNFRFKPGQRALAHHPTVEIPAAYWTKWLMIYFGGAAIMMVIIGTIIVGGHTAPVEDAKLTPPLIVTAPVGMGGAQAIITNSQGKASLVATLDQARSSDKGYVGQIRGSLSNGHLYAVSVGCAKDDLNCSPLRVGERIAFAFLPKDDLDEYLVGPTIFDGQKIMVKATIRRIDSVKSAVYFMYE